MDRGSFIKGVIGALAFGRFGKLTAEPAAAAVGGPAYAIFPNGTFIVSGGGLCAPLTPIYEFPDWSPSARPVRDALPSFEAERGGIFVETVENGWGNYEWEEATA